LVPRFVGWKLAAQISRRSFLFVVLSIEEEEEEESRR
jgi:hypothetical protein